MQLKDLCGEGPRSSVKALINRTSISEAELTWNRKEKNQFIVYRLKTQWLTLKTDALYFNHGNLLMKKTAYESHTNRKPIPLSSQSMVKMWQMKEWLSSSWQMNPWPLAQPLMLPPFFYSFSAALIQMFRFSISYRQTLNYTIFALFSDLVTLITVFNYLKGRYSHKS